MGNEEVKEGFTRVSEVLSQWDKLSLINPDVLERKAQLGTNVHNAIANYYNGVPSVLTDEEGGKYYASFLLWNAERKASPIHIEKRLYDEETMLTGCIDAV